MVLNIKETLNQIEKLSKDLFSYKNEMIKNISKSDKSISKLYHEIECRNYDVVSGYKLLVKLQEQLRSRRHYKNEFNKVNSATSGIYGLHNKITKSKETIDKIDNKVNNILKLVSNKG